MPLDFIDTSGNHRLAVFTDMLDVIRSGDDDPGRVLTSLVTLMRRAFGVHCFTEVTTAGLPPGSYRLTRAWRREADEAVPNRSPWRGDGVPVRTGGVIAELLATGRAVAARGISFTPDDPCFPELGAYHSVVATPGGLGEPDLWVLILDERPDAFEAGDVEALVLRVNLIGLALKQLSTLRELRQATAYIEAEVDRIGAIQRALLPPPNPAVPGLEVAASWETFDRAGGDLYDYARLPTGSWGFLVADASGHGPSATVVSAVLHAIIHTLPVMGDGVVSGAGSVLKFANEQLAAKRIEQSFVTAFLCTWDPRGRTLAYTNAGHPRPFLRRRNGAVARLDAVADLPLAILDDTTYAEHVQPLASGDVVVIVTDGITEAMDAAHDLFGDDRLTRVLQSANGTASEILANILAAVREHQGATRSSDDQTVLVLRVK